MPQGAFGHRLSAAMSAGARARRCERASALVTGKALDRALVSYRWARQ